MRSHGVRVIRRGFLLLLAGLGLLLVNSPAAEPREPLREAIQRQRVLKVNYGGYDRLIEPHALGTTAGGHAALLAWQIEGGSKSDPPTGWRLFVLSDLHQVTITVRGFTPRTSYRREKSPLRTLELDVFGRARDPVPSSET